MKTLLVSAAFAAAMLAPTAASAQAIPPAVVAIVDLAKVTADCNACKTAQAALQSQVSALQAREQALGTPLQTEQKSIQAAVDALAGKAPDAALQARIKAFQAKGEQAQQEVESRKAQIQNNQAYIQKQIADKLAPIYQQIMQRRGANILVEVGTTIAAAANVEVTNDVTAGLNTALPSIVTTAPAAAPQPQGR